MVAQTPLVAPQLFVQPLDRAVEGDIGVARFAVALHQQPAPCMHRYVRQDQMPLAAEHDMGFDGSVEIPLDDGCGRRRDMPAKGIPDIDLLTRDQNLHRRYRVGTARIRLMDSTGNLPPSRVPYEPRGARKSRGHPVR